MCIALRQQVCVFSLLYSGLKWKVHSEISVICVEGESHSPQSANCSNVTSVWYGIAVSQGKGLEPGSLTLTLHWNNGGVPAQSVATFQSKGGGSGEGASFALVGDGIQLRVIVSDLWGTCRLCWRQLRDCPDSTRLLVVSNKHDFCRALSVIQLKMGLAVPWTYSPPPYAAVSVIGTLH